MNKPIRSKINWTSLIVAFIGLLAAMDYFSPEVEEQLVEITMLAAPSLIIVFRTWFTEKKNGAA